MVRPIRETDESRWRELWDAYTRFYEKEPEERVTRYTWGRLLDAACPVYGAVAEAEDGHILGFANYVIHENTSTMTPVCYLEDLYVDKDVRGAGTGGLLIDWLIEQMKSRGWSRLYWHTKENNYRARGLYDKYTSQSGFVRYVLTNPSS